MRLLNLHVRKEMQTRSFSASLTASSQETMRDASAGTAEQKLSSRAPSCPTAARYHFLTASTIGAGGVLCRINCWFVRAC